jgi:hypothetical protein
MLSERSNAPQKPRSVARSGAMPLFSLGTRSIVPLAEIRSVERSLGAFDSFATESTVKNG